MPDRHRFELAGASYELQIEIAASQQRVWKALTEKLSAWWLPDFHILGPDSIVELEPRAGGRLFEQSDDRELLWYTVLSIAPAKSLSLVGYCTPEFGGPLTTMLTARLTSQGEATQLSFTDALYGRVTDNQVDSLRAGWIQLLTDGLKSFAETAA